MTTTTTSGETQMQMLDRSRAAGEQGTWTVLVRNLGARTAADGQEVYLHEGVTAASVELWAGGALVFRAEDGELVRAYGPGGWLEVERA